jgi:hypothetical protein
MKFSTKYIDTRMVRYFLVAIAATFCVSGHAQTPAVNVSTVLADSFASYVVKSDHSLWMWGQCGTFYGGTPTQYSIAVNQVSCGSDSIYGGHMIFTDAGNNLFGIGSNSGAGLNVLSNTASNSSGFTPIGSDFVQISTSNSHSLGIKSNGTLWAWGTNGAGQLGDGSTTGRAQPVLIGSGYASVYTGDFYTLALKTDGSMWGWGFNSSSSFHQ